MTPGRMPPRVRIAPSPTGPPHVGTAYVALFNRTFAKKHGGKFLLRIEDTDRTRSTRESEEAIYRALRWLGLDWDEGPDVGGPYAPYRQSERSDTYREHCETLLENGSAYRCFCSAERLEEMRAFQRAAKRPPGYDGTCRRVPPDESARRAAAGEAFVVRLRIPEGGATSFDDLLRGKVQIENKDVDDQVLLKSDGFPTYHLANVVDDRLMGITHVLRAEEWIPSTPKHVLLYEAFGWEPPVFCHLPLLRNQDKSKISKRKNPTSLDWYRDEGFLPRALLNFLALMGWNPGDGTEVFGIERMLADFEPEQIITSSPVFDLQKLEWLNGEYIRAAGVDELATELDQHLRHVGKEPPPRERILEILPLVHERLKRLSEWTELTAFFFADPAVDPAEYEAVKKLDAPRRKDVLRSALEALTHAPFEKEALEREVKARCEALGVKLGDYLMCLRIAITGKRATPPLLESMVVLGREACLRRVAAAAG